MIASTMVRASAKGLPLRPVGRGSMSAIIDHWASESTWNLDIWPVSQDGRYIFVRHALAGTLRAASEQGLEEIIVIVGPDGGISPEELEGLRELEARPVLL